MATKNNSGTNIDTLTKLQPMPKRFTVWDKEDGDPLFDGKVFTLRELISEFGHVPSVLDGCEICQSTNLFDKDGKEIFEGGIVKWLDARTGMEVGEGVVRIKDGNTFIERHSYDLYPAWDEEKKNLILRGHILSGPELLEEK